MLEDIFLTYANSTSLREKPETLREIFQHFADLDIQLCEEAYEMMDLIIQHFTNFLKYPDYDSALVVYNKMIEEAEHPWDVAPIGVAFEGIYGYVDGYCEKKPTLDCYYRREALPVFQEKLFNGEDRIHCYECDQIYFRKQLDAVVAGKEYSKIHHGHFATIIMNAHESMHTSVDIEMMPKGSPFSEKFEKSVSFWPKMLLQAKSPSVQSSEFLVNDRCTT